MGTYTTNLNLYNTNMSTDGNDTFDFQRDLNDNNDKIDSAVGKLSALNTTVQTSLVGAINEVVSNCGALANLSTTDKTSLVNAINELLSSLDGFATKSLGNLDSTGQAVIDKKVEIEALLAQNGYAKFKWKQNNTISKLIVQWFRITHNKAEYTDASLPCSFTSVDSYSVVGSVNANTATTISNSQYIDYYRKSNSQITWFGHTSDKLNDRNVIAIGY